MRQAKVNDDLVALFERRVELLKDVVELAGRQRRCIEQGKHGRLDRLIARRDHGLRQWRKLEAQLEKDLNGAEAATLSEKHKVRLIELIGESNELLEAIKREDRVIGEAAIAQHTGIVEALAELRAERAMLRAYAGKAAPGSRSGVDRSA